MEIDGVRVLAPHVEAYRRDVLGYTEEHDLLVEGLNPAA